MVKLQSGIVTLAVAIMMSGKNRAAMAAAKAAQAQVAGTVPPADVPAVLGDVAPAASEAAPGDPAPADTADALPAGTPRIVVTTLAERAHCDAEGVRIIVEAMNGYGEPGDKTPQKKLAEVTFEFSEGLMTGVRLEGGGVWYGVKGGATEVYAGMPQRSYGPFGKATYDIVADVESDRVKGTGRKVSGPNLDRVKGWIVDTAVAMFGGVDGLRTVVKGREETAKAPAATPAAPAAKAETAAPARPNGVVRL